MQIQRVQNYSPQFNGTLSIYNFNKRKWASRVTTIQEDKLLYDLYEKFCPKDLRKVAGVCCDKFVGEMEHSQFLEYMSDLPKFKGFDFPKIKKLREINADIEEWNVPLIERPFDNPNSMHGYEVSLDKSFRLKHSFDKLKLIEKNLW